VREIDTIGVVAPARNEARRLPRSLGRGDHGESFAAPVGADRAGGPGDRGGGPEHRPNPAGRQAMGGGRDRARPGRRGRAAGVTRLLDSEAGRGTPAGRAWIACSDADSVVPPDGLRTQLEHARRGTDMVLGTVRPDPGDVPPAVLDSWYPRHVVTDGHPHVHGANLGLRGDTYLAPGGFADVAMHEDVLLSRAVRAVGGRLVSTGDSPVITSGRTDGRSPGGLADYLRELGQQQDRMQA
jgi:hypothetical protein